VHGTRWVKELWGVSTLYDPSTSSEDIDLEAFFAPSLPHLTNPSIYSHEDAEGNRVRCEIPLEVNTALTPQDILFRLRLDTPFEGQIKLLKKTLKAAQEAAGHGRVNAGARLIDIGMSSVWLRGWDAAQELEMHDRAKVDKALAGKIQKTPFPRSIFIERLRADLDGLPKEIKATKQKKTSSGVVKNFGDKLDKALGVERIDNWLYRAKKYIESNSHFYRRTIAASLDHLDYVNYVPGKTLHPPTGSEQSART